MPRVQDYEMNVHWSDEDDAYVARFPAWPGVAAHGDTAEQAVHEATIALELAIEVATEHGDRFPAPDAQLPSGRFVLRLPRSLHAELVRLARREKVSLNQLILTALAREQGRHDRDDDRRSSSG